MPAVTEIVQQKIQRGQALLPVYNLISLISLLSALYDQRTDIIIFGGESVNVVNELGYFFIRPRKGALIQRYDIVVARKKWFSPSPSIICSDSTVCREFSESIVIPP